MSEVELTRSKDLYDPITKPGRNQKVNVPTSTGNSSINPGVWLTELYVSGDRRKAKESTKADSEALASAKFILECYRLRPIYQSEEKKIRENRWLSLLDRKDPAVAASILKHRNPEDEFKYDAQKQQDWLLPPIVPTEDETVAEDEDDTYELAEQLKYDDLNAEKGLQTDIEEYARKRKDTPAPDASEGYSAPISIGKVTDSELDTKYARWHADPRQENETSLFDTLGRFITEQARMANPDDSYTKRGDESDLGQSLCLEMIALLRKKQAAGEVLEKELSHYVRRSWKFGGWKQKQQIQKHDRLFIGTEVIGATDSDGDAGEWDQLDKHEEREWALSQRSSGAPDETEEEYLQRCWATLPALRPDLQDVAGPYLLDQVQSQAERAKQLGISQQAFSKRMKKAKESIRNHKKQEIRA